MHRVYSLGTNATPTARNLSVFDVKIFFYHIHLPHKRRLRLAHKTMVVPMRSHAFEHVTAQLSTWASGNDPREHPYSVRCAELAPTAHAQRFLSSNEHIDYTATTEALQRHACVPCKTCTRDADRALSCTDMSYYMSGYRPCSATGHLDAKLNGTVDWHSLCANST